MALAEEKVTLMSYSEVHTLAYTPSNVGQISLPTSCSPPLARSDGESANGSDLERKARRKHCMCRSHSEEGI